MATSAQEEIGRVQGGCKEGARAVGNDRARESMRRATGVGEQWQSKGAERTRRSWHSTEKDKKQASRNEYETSNKIKIHPIPISIIFPSPLCSAQHTSTSPLNSRKTACIFLYFLTSSSLSSDIILYHKPLSLIHI